MAESIDAHVRFCRRLDLLRAQQESRLSWQMNVEQSTQSQELLHDCTKIIVSHAGLLSCQSAQVFIGSCIGATVVYVLFGSSERWTYSELAAIQPQS